MIDTTRPVQTVRGRKVEILAVLPEDKAVDGQTIVALVYAGSGTSVETYSPDGSFVANEQSMLDLVNVEVLSHA